jgi:hypothetical protein
MEGGEKGKRKEKLIWAVRKKPIDITIDCCARNYQL